MATPEFDLPRGLAAMADYPEVLKRLGVVRRLRVSLANSGFTIDPNGGEVTITVEPTITPKSTAVTPQVAPVGVKAFLSPTRFALQSNGRVDLSEAAIGLVEIDTDSASLKLVDLARQLYNADVANAKAEANDELPPNDVPERMALPSLRNAGLSLNEGDRASNLRAKLIANAPLLNAVAGVTLNDATQAIKGHVMDVWDSRSQRWHSLCQRIGTYSLPGGGSFTASDEGTISLAATSNATGGEKAPMYLHQSLIRWTGWSLVAERPGQLVQTEQVEPTDRTPKPPASPGLPGFNAKFVARPGTLPRLRFGVGYRFGLRAVDVAGHVEPLDPTSTDFTRAAPPAGQPPAPYLRFEPVVAPVVVPDAPMTEGESIETIVIRPEPGFVKGVSNRLAVIGGGSSARHIAPPKVNVQLCEDHGMFDTVEGAPDPDKYRMIAERDRADLSTVGTPDPRRPTQRYVPNYLDMSWLPDPLSRGAAFNGLPGGTSRVSFDDRIVRPWPANLGAFRLQLIDGSSSPVWNRVKRLFTVAVPRGETRIVRLSSYVDNRDLGLLGLLGWLRASGVSDAEVAAVEADVANGLAWQLTPYRSLTLVNAVRVPVTTPVLAIDFADPDRRPVGATKVDLAGIATVHRPSTGALNIVANWVEPIDDPSPANNPAPPRNVPMTANPTIAPAGGSPGAELRVDYDPDPATGAGVAFVATQLFNDNKRHRVTYKVMGTSRYMEYFVQRGNIVLTDQTSFVASTAGIVPGTDSVRSTDGQTVFRRGFDYDVDLVAGSVRRLPGSTIPSGTPVELAIVAPPVTKTSAGILRDIPSTARPLPPKVAWIVPTFGWNDTENRRTKTRKRARSGGGLRIFLERPWYSSGVGEQLAVVLLDGTPPANIDQDQELLDILSQLGRDPVVGSANPARFPTPSEFTLATIKKGNIKPAEFAVSRPAATVAVAAHDVVWDAERQRWAVDVVLPTGTNYQPFLKLALARYQDVSVGDTALSPITNVEWVQLAADRSATLQRDSRRAQFTITVTGRSASGTAAFANQPNSMSAILQRTTVAQPTDFDWTAVGTDSGVPMAGTTQLDGSTTWTTTLPLPNPRHKYRVVLVEYERFAGGSRMVYTDVIPLPV